MISAVVLNAVGGLVIVGGWALAVWYVYRSLAADSRRPASPERRIPRRQAEDGAAGMGHGTVPASSLAAAGMAAPEDQDGERAYSLARSAR